LDALRIPAIRSLFDHAAPPRGNCLGARRETAPEGADHPPARRGV